MRSGDFGPDSDSYSDCIIACSRFIHINLDLHPQREPAWNSSCTRRHGSHYQQCRAGRVHHLFHRRATRNIGHCALHLALLSPVADDARLLPRSDLLRPMAAVNSCSTRADRLGVERRDE